TATASVPTIDGGVAMAVTVRREGKRIMIEASGATKPWSVLLRGLDGVGSVEGGAAAAELLGMRVAPEDRATVVRLVV
ncbi:MAG: hypothetical protein MUF84_17375, partial [Anaerolineae bacterium]|nr:hypothetical protein [Anaerolineae bacterium]